PHLLEALKFPSGLVATSASNALARIGPGAIPGLVQLVQSADPRHREMAASTLAAYGPTATPAVFYLKPLLNDPDDYVSAWGAIALGRIAQIEAVIPLLIEILRHADSFVRYQAALALGSFGPKAIVAIHALQTLTEDSDPRVAEGAQQALQAINR